MKTACRDKASSATRERLAPYDRVAGMYDLLAYFYSGGGIRRAKLVHLEQLSSGQSLLYAGAGTGAECVAAARQGHKVTAVDLSPAMLQRCAELAESAAVEINLIEADVGQLSVRYDVVVAPFFLNVFAPAGVDSMLAKLAKLLRPGGQLVVVDFKAPSSSFLFRQVQKLYYSAPLLFFWLFTRNAWHGVYDYPMMAERAIPEFRLASRVTTRAWGLPLFETISWQSPS